MVSVEQLSVLANDAWQHLSNAQTKGTINRLQDIFTLPARDSAFSQAHTQLVVQQLLDRLQVTSTHGLAFGKKLRIAIAPLPWLRSELVSLNYWLGSMHQRVGELVQAQACFHSAIQAMASAPALSIDKAIVYLSAACASSSLNQHQKAYSWAVQAIYVAKEALLLNGTSEQTLRNLGNAYIRAGHELTCLGKPRQSVSFYKTAYKLLSANEEFPLGDLVTDCQRSIQRIVRKSPVKPRRFSARRFTPEFDSRFPLEEKPRTFEQTRSFIRTPTAVRFISASTSQTKRLKSTHRSRADSRIDSRPRLRSERESRLVIAAPGERCILSSLTQDVHGVKYKFMLVRHREGHMLECLNPKSMKVLWTEVDPGWSLEALVRKVVIKPLSIEVDPQCESGPVLCNSAEYNNLHVSSSLLLYP